MLRKTLENPRNHETAPDGKEGLALEALAGGAGLNLCGADKGADLLRSRSKAGAEEALVVVEAAISDHETGP